MAIVSKVLEIFLIVKMIVPLSINVLFIFFLIKCLDPDDIVIDLLEFASVPLINTPYRCRAGRVL